ncbi:MAG: hypothetical protein NC310_07830 [Roseburia sp.]|nr:hypothetical protein [Anaeroplasma bactoclasticum]MCM1196957.1 hypothetical protein [Roseburia sp.]MCM1557541.1 hypothetical protein [Anaeroplasma bactoclasticum]
MMEEQYQLAKEKFEEKNFVEALHLFSKMDYKDSKKYENECIDFLEDLIFYSKKTKALEYLEKLSFYDDYSYFTDAYKRRKIQFLSKIFMFSCALIGTIILIFVFLL